MAAMASSQIRRQPTPTQRFLDSSNWKSGVTRRFDNNKATFLISTEINAHHNVAC
jgi:hypothetical protein